MDNNATLTQPELDAQNAATGQSQFNSGPAKVGGSIGNESPILPPVSQTQDASEINNQISGNTQGVVFPQAPKGPTQGVNDNVGAITPPISSASDIISQGTQETPAEKSNTTLLQKVAALIGQNKGPTELTNASEEASGIPAMARSKQALADQIQGYSDQTQKLINDAMAGGTEQNSYIQSVHNGTDIFRAHTNYEDSLRENQIKQASLAAASLTAKAAYYAINENYSSAKDAADKAATAQYEHQQNQIDYMNSLIAANAPAMNKQEKAQADLVTANLADRQRQLDQAKDDKKSIIALATAAMKNYPNDTKAHYAAQQALAESNQQQPDISKVFGLIGQYQSDPIATQKALADLQNTRLQNQKLRLDNAANDPSNPNYGGSGTMLQPYLKTSYDGSQYVDLSTLTPKDKAQYARIANNQGLKVVLTPEDSDKVSHIAVTKSNLNDIMNAFNKVPVEKQGFPAGQGIANSIKGFFGNADIRAYQDFRTSAINTLQALAGGSGSGFRITQSEIAAAIKDIPILEGASADTPASAQKKIDNLNGQLDKWSVQILGGGNTATKDAAKNSTTKSGKPFDYAKAKADGVSDADIQAYLASH